MTKYITLGYFIFLLIAVHFFTGCRTNSVINKVTHLEHIYRNTCDSLFRDFDKIIAANKGESEIQVSYFDNSQFSYFYMEPGQFEWKGDTLLFRLHQDLDYARYLDKKLSIRLHLHSKTFQDSNTYTLVIDRDYYQQHKEPFFRYELIIPPTDIMGAQLAISFDFVRLDATGKIIKYYCETDQHPVGTLTPVCCEPANWAHFQLQFARPMPSVSAEAEQVKYAGFTGKSDLIFIEDSYNIKDSAVVVNQIQGFVQRYQEYGYEVAGIDLKGYASIEGSAKYNETLSERRTQTVYQALQRLYPNVDAINYRGMGEDWRRLKDLTMESELSSNQKDKILAIANLDVPMDQRERALRETGFWQTIEQNILNQTRHTEITMTFRLAENLKHSLPNIPHLFELGSYELDQIVQSEVKMEPYQKGAHIPAQLSLINELILRNPSANRFALRATYHLAQNKLDLCMNDLRYAVRLAPQQDSYRQELIMIQQYLQEKLSFQPKTRVSATDQFPADKQVLRNQLISLTEQYQAQRAFEGYTLLAEQTALSAADLNNRGVLHLYNHHVLAAQRDFQAALALNPKLAPAHFNLAVIAAYRGLTQRSLSYLDQSVAENPRYRQFVSENPVFQYVLEDPRFDKYW